MRLVCAIEQLPVNNGKNNKLAHTLKETDVEFRHKLNVYALIQIYACFMHVFWLIYFSAALYM